MAARYSSFSPSALPMEYFPRTPVPPDNTRGRHYLVPGRIFASKEPTVITAVVGSGVSLCLYDPSTQIGGANHFLFVDTMTGEANPLKYASHANQGLFDQMLQLGANAGTMQARLFGGTQSTINFTSVEQSLGDKNVEAALRFLQTRGLPLISRETGGLKGRKLMFQTDSGVGKCEEL